MDHLPARRRTGSHNRAGAGRPRPPRSRRPSSGAAGRRPPWAGHRSTDHPSTRTSSPPARTCEAAVPPGRSWATAVAPSGDPGEEDRKGQDSCSESGRDRRSSSRPPVLHGELEPARIGHDDKSVQAATGCVNRLEASQDCRYRSGRMARTATSREQLTPNPWSSIMHHRIRLLLMAVLARGRGLRFRAGCGRRVRSSDRPWPRRPGREAPQMPGHEPVIPPAASASPELHARGRPGDPQGLRGASRCRHLGRHGCRRTSGHRA